MKKTNKKILESKRIIKEEKKKIKLEKRNIRKKKYEKFMNTKTYKFFSKIFSVFKIDKDTYSFSEVFVITLASLVVGAFACFSVLTIFTNGRNYFMLSKDLGKFFDVYETLVDNYYDDIDKEELVDEAIRGMVSSVGDVYTSYSDSATTDEFNELVSGIYEGIGTTIQLQETGVKVIEIFEDSPSEKAGIKVGDILLKVDDLDATVTDITEIASYIKTKDSDKITMVISRDDKEMTFEVKREKIEMPVVSGTVYEKNDKKVGYISISIFSSVAYKQFKQELKELEEQNIEGLVIDVRNNNGGYLTTVTDVISALLPKGKIIYQVEKGETVEVAKDKTFASKDYPIAVLVNGGSASASEILAAAIKESYGGYIVGTKTYGKGTVQQVKNLSDGSMVKYTVENWLTPDGNWINEIGVEPTDVIELADAYYSNSIVENDNQLQKALELVSK